MRQVGTEHLPLFTQAENDSTVPLRARYRAWRATDAADAIVAWIHAEACARLQAGTTHLSINQLFEGARGRFGHLNNSWRSFVARELLERTPELGQVLETRPLKRKAV